MRRKHIRSTSIRWTVQFTCVWFVLLAAGCSSRQIPPVTTVSTDIAAPSNVVKSGSAIATESSSMSDADSESDEFIAPVVVAGPGIGQYAPLIKAEFVLGHGPVTLEEARGKVVIVDFWATFCAPCQKTFPKYQALLDQFGADLAIIAVSVDEDASREQLEEFAQMTRVKFPIVWDTEQKTAAAYRLPKMPSSFVIDKRGIIRHIHAGSAPNTVDEIAREIRLLAVQ